MNETYVRFTRVIYEETIVEVLPENRIRCTSSTEERLLLDCLKRAVGQLESPQPQPSQMLLLPKRELE